MKGSVLFKYHKYLIILFFFTGLNNNIWCQKHPNSPVYKDYKSPDSTSIFKKVDNSFKLWQSYLLLKEANAGNPMAQHELGLRYLTGNGFQADTVKGFYWIQKAAEFNLPAANYNLGILLNNGWGTNWNPFEAFKHFEIAARDSMPEALYVLGLLYTDNLIVPRNYEKAFHLIKKAADLEYKPADDVLLEFYRRGIATLYDSSFSSEMKKYDNKKSSDENDLINPADNITFFRSANDSSSKVNDVTLFKEVIRDGSDEMKKALGIQMVNDSTFQPDSTIINSIKNAANYGSPEALVMLGRCFSKGIIVQKNIILAAENYLRAVRYDSPRAPRLLWDLLQKKDFFRILKVEADKKNPDAEFVWAELQILHFDNQITEKDALRFLEEAASKNHIPSIIELGLCYYSGTYILQNKEKALSIWQGAKQLGSKEAEVRIAVVTIQEKIIGEDPLPYITVLTNAAKKGSLLSQVALGYCYETGYPVSQNTSLAVQYYRLSAQRGSRGAYRGLKRMYDKIRPDDKEFLVLDEQQF
jgi:TPR repeat protein